MRKKQVSKELDVFLLLTVCLSLSHLMAIHGTAHETKGGKIYKHSTFHKNKFKAIYLIELASTFMPKASIFKWAHHILTLTNSKKHFVVYKRSAVKNSFRTYVWSKVDFYISRVSVVIGKKFQT